MKKETESYFVLYFYCLLNNFIKKKKIKTRTSLNYTFFSISRCQCFLSAPIELSSVSATKIDRFEEYVIRLYDDIFYEFRSAFNK